MLGEKNKGKLRQNRALMHLLWKTLYRPRKLDGRRNVDINVFDDDLDGNF